MLISSDNPIKFGMFMTLIFENDSFYSKSLNTFFIILFHSFSLESFDILDIWKELYTFEFF